MFYVTSIACQDAFCLSFDCAQDDKNLLYVFISGHVLYFFKKIRRYPQPFHKIGLVSIFLYRLMLFYGNHHRL